MYTYQWNFIFKNATEYLYIYLYNNIAIIVLESPSGNVYIHVYLHYRGSDYKKKKKHFFFFNLTYAERIIRVLVSYRIFIVFLAADL